MKKQYIGWSCLLLFLVLTSCKTTRVTSEKSETKSKKTKKEVRISAKQQRINETIRESDALFEKFNLKYGYELNRYTLAYIDTYKHIAIKKMMEYHIPASITLAQGILESGNGRSQLTRKANNHFGIKCHKGWKGKKVYHDDDRRNECFRKYDNPEGSFNDHSLFLTTRGRYDFLFDLKEDNYKGWARGLKKAGYATDRKYPSKLINLIEDYHLYDYDKLVLKRKKNTKGKKYKEVEDIPQKTSKDYIIVQRGDTLYSLAKAHNLSVNQLKKINGLTNNEIKVNQILYIK